jgi:aspartyl-tRNA(Asn)/glutamyl-tRNA(Gln) amidotransferase subunit A
VVRDGRSVGYEWALGNAVTLRDELGDLWPGCKDELTLEMAFAIQIGETAYNLDVAARAEHQRIEFNEIIATIFDQVDFVIAATNPEIAPGAEVTLPNQVCGNKVKPENDGVLTIPANITGVPAVSIPVGTVDGLPVGMQVIARHHHDAELLDLALAVERERPWPLTAPA